jgi:hypothetical protein
MFLENSHQVSLIFIGLLSYPIIYQQLPDYLGVNMRLISNSYLIDQNK